jgi:hypothetical protein
MQHCVDDWHKRVRKTQPIKESAHPKPRLGTLRSSLPKKRSNQGPTQLCISKAGARLEQLNEKHKEPTNLFFSVSNTLKSVGEAKLSYRHHTRGL